MIVYARMAGLSISITANLLGFFYAWQSLKFIQYGAIQNKHPEKNYLSQYGFIYRSSVELLWDLVEQEIYCIKMLLKKPADIAWCSHVNVEAGCQINVFNIFGETILFLESKVTYYPVICIVLLLKCLGSVHCSVFYYKILIINSSDFCYMSMPTFNLINCCNQKKTYIFAFRIACSTLFMQVLSHCPKTCWRVD